MDAGRRTRLEGVQGQRDGSVRVGTKVGTKVGAKVGAKVGTDPPPSSPSRTPNVPKGRGQRTKQDEHRLQRVAARRAPLAQSSRTNRSAATPPRRASQSRAATAAPPDPAQRSRARSPSRAFQTGIAGASASSRASIRRRRRQSSLSVPPPRRRLIVPELPTELASSDSRSRFQKPFQKSFHLPWFLSASASALNLASAALTSASLASQTLRAVAECARDSRVSARDVSAEPFVGEKRRRFWRRETCTRGRASPTRKVARRGVRSRRRRKRRPRVFKAAASYVCALNPRGARLHGALRGEMVPRRRRGVVGGFDERLHRSHRRPRRVDAAERGADESARILPRKHPPW